MIKVLGHGSSTPDVFLISDAAFGDDMSSGYALSGYQEAVLRELCNENELNLKDMYRTCLIKDVLPHKEETKEAAAANHVVAKASIPILRDEIINLNPFLLVPLGELSFSTLTSIHNIRKFRGSVLLANNELGLSKP